MNLRDPFLLDVIRLHPQGLGHAVVLLPDEETGHTMPLTSPHLDDTERTRLIRIAGVVLSRVGVPK
jgi:hypothetical protein